MDSLEQNLLSTAWATHREKRAIPVQSHPHCTPSGHRAGKDIHDQKETMCARNWTYSEPSGRVALHLPFLSACVKSPAPTHLHLYPISWVPSLLRTPTLNPASLGSAQSGNWVLPQTETSTRRAHPVFLVPADQLQFVWITVSCPHNEQVPHPCLCHSLSSLKAFSKSLLAQSQHWASAPLLVPSPVSLCSRLPSSWDAFSTGSTLEVPIKAQPNSWLTKKRWKHLLLLLCSLSLFSYPWPYPWINE